MILPITARRHCQILPLQSSSVADRRTSLDRLARGGLSRTQEKFSGSCSNGIGRLLLGAFAGNRLPVALINAGFFFAEEALCQAVDVLLILGDSSTDVSADAGIPHVEMHHIAVEAAP